MRFSAKSPGANGLKMMIYSVCIIQIYIPGLRNASGLSKYRETWQAIALFDPGGRALPYERGWDARQEILN